MATVAELMQLREPLEESIRAALVAQGLSAVTRKTFPSKFQQARPRHEIKCIIGQATGHMFSCPDGHIRYDGWRFNLAWQVVTNPKNSNNEDNSTHEEHVGIARAYASTLAQNSWSDATNFPNTLIAEILRETGAPSTLKAQDGVEYTTLNFSGIICIRQTAWPET